MLHNRNSFGLPAASGVQIIAKEVRGTSFAAICVIQQLNLNHYLKWTTCIRGEAVGRACVGRDFSVHRLKLSIFWAASALIFGQFPMCIGSSFYAGSTACQRKRGSAPDRRAADTVTTRRNRVDHVVVVAQLLLADVAIVVLTLETNRFQNHR